MQSTSHTARQAHSCFHCDTQLHEPVFRREQHVFCAQACFENWLARPHPPGISKKARAKARKALQREKKAQASQRAAAPIISRQEPQIAAEPAPEAKSDRREPALVQSATEPATRDLLSNALLARPARYLSPYWEDVATETAAEETQEAAPSEDAKPDIETPPTEAEVFILGIPARVHPLTLPAAAVEPETKAPLIVEQAVEKEAASKTLHAQPPRVITKTVFLRQSADANRPWALVAGVAIASAVLGYLASAGNWLPSDLSAPAQAALIAPASPAYETVFAPKLRKAPTKVTEPVVLLHGEAVGKNAAYHVNGRQTPAVEQEPGRYTLRAALRPGFNTVQFSAETGGERLFSRAHIIEFETAHEPVREPAKAFYVPGFAKHVKNDTTHGNRKRKAVSFTFDGGASANASSEILDTLRRAGVRTTLFLTGEFIRNNPGVVKLALEDGHEIGNHTWNHPHLTTYDENRRHHTRPNISKSSFQKQLIDTAAVYEDLTGEPLAPLWRAPFGEVNSELRAWAAELGYRHIGWSRRVGRVASLDSLDWVDDQDSNLYLTGNQLLDRFGSLAAGDQVAGGIFLMHLGTRRDADQLHRQLPELLKRYRQEGYAILPVSKLLR